MIDWNQIDTVLLDMDGTLLDLNFDTYFWVEYVPQRFAEREGMSLDEAKAELYPMMQALVGTMNWYCVDYWTETLGLDIALLKEEVEHLIAVHPHVPEFLERCRQADKRVVLVTNAHQKSLRLKMDKTRLAGHFDNIICSHAYGMPKEDAAFWPRLQQDEPFEPRRALLVDDSLSVLRSAKDYGIGWLLAVFEPDSQQPRRDVGEFDAIESFADIMPPPG